ncbi:MAG: glycine oxidase ThiO [Acidobacteriota bacterium]
MSDVLIVGGGVVGLSIAYELSQREISVTVVERSAAGMEASWAGAGILKPASLEGAVSPMDRLRAHSLQRLAKWSPRLLAETGIDNGYRRCGGFRVALEESDVEPLRRAAERWQAEGIAVEEWDSTTRDAREPALAGDLPLVYHLPDEAQLRSPWHVRALAVACRRRGVELLTRRPVRDFRIEGARIVAADTAHGPLSADRFVVAAGAWTPELFAGLGQPIAGTPVRGQIVLLDAPAPLFQRVVWAGSRYLVPRPEGKVLVGSTQEDAGFDARPTARGVTGLLHLAARVVPALAEVPFERAWAGLRPGSPDSLPLIGPVPRYDNLFAACGHFRSGFDLSAGTARVMAELLLGEEPAVPLTAFRPDRFA